MKKNCLTIIVTLWLTSLRVSTAMGATESWIRINQLGYLPQGVKVAVWASKGSTVPANFQLVDSASGKAVFTASTGKPFGRYGPFNETARLDFSSWKQTGTFYLKAGEVKSPYFRIATDVYAGAADFTLRYMRQQRSLFNPFLKDSCHTHDGYTLYGPMPDSTHLDVAGGWHDASDYLQYSTTSANATYHLLAAYRDFPQVFGDRYAANGLEGGNHVPDILDEARWGLDWLLKMHPRDNWMFNQIADDRDHHGMRLPKEDPFYGRGFERPVYFCSGQPQVRGKFMNQTTGVASTAGKFSSAFALGYDLLKDKDAAYAGTLRQKALTAYDMGRKQPGVCQTASVLSPYIYAEDNWVDDMELAAASLYRLNGKEAYRQQALDYAGQEKVTPWLGKDTAHHYQWYPFINLGHYELARQLKGASRQTITGYYQTGIDKVWQQAKNNAFYRYIPFIWCSNNLTTAFAIQCYWYRQLTGSNTYAALEQANFDWLFGCNPWGTSMVYGLPAHGDTPEDPHSAFTHLGHYPVDGALVDGPVYTNIYKNLIGIKLSKPDVYAEFQSDLAVYHDDFGDYSTNEPTMDGTASLIYLLAAMDQEGRNHGAAAPANGSVHTYAAGAIIRGDTSRKTLTLVFTGDEFADGGQVIRGILKQQKVPAAFFLTGKFYGNPAFQPLVKQLKADGHYLGPHSDQHPLYCDWQKRDSLLITHAAFEKDLAANYRKMQALGIPKNAAHYFLPPYEWYNDTIAQWTRAAGLQLVNFTPGTRSNADYTTPAMKGYRSSEEIYQSILQYADTQPAGLNGFMLLLHIGTDPARTDKFYNRLNELITDLKKKGYRFVQLGQLLH
ncbi:polysaccharide deacetylase family protein [Chitinophaga sp. G-6-1-13]|uniref:Polysaccharide deacetylase family protein n=1 Tax=Chitinophaga fulva TaxID=2728842 RepID=A0A848GPF4_9BACT|nr:glycoside hydrolase family 9 protein [Chitinophaga fulva]NML39857.1 polysaccharide deacetylase family protein [Chitinophaga fulva]